MSFQEHCEILDLFSSKEIEKLEQKVGEHIGKAETRLKKGISDLWKTKDKDLDKTRISF